MADPTFKQVTPKGDEFALSLLGALGIPTARARRAVITLEAHEVPTIDVSYWVAPWIDETTGDVVEAVSRFRIVPADD